MQVQQGHGGYEPPTKRGLKSEKAVEARVDKECRERATANVGLRGSLASSSLGWLGFMLLSILCFWGAFAWEKGREGREGRKRMKGWGGSPAKPGSDGRWGHELFSWVEKAKGKASLSIPCKILKSLRAQTKNLRVSTWEFV